MIRVAPQPEPAQFNELVRIPGRAFLDTNPTPTSKDFEKHPYWRAILTELREAYGKVCAYSSFWIPAATGRDTVEHYLPKVPHPQQAYEWTNYRFVSHRLNQRKGTQDDVVDPFAIDNGWFVIDFPSLLVKPSDQLEGDVRESVIKSVKRLGLNDPGSCLAQREDYTRAYCLGEVTFVFIQREAPFLAAEITRQNLEATLNDVMRYAD